MMGPIRQNSQMIDNRELCDTKQTVQTEMVGYDSNDEKPTNWLEFFSGTEFQDAVKESQLPTSTKPTIEKQAAESDSEPSVDNFDENELAERFEAAV